MSHAACQESSRQPVDTLFQRVQILGVVSWRSGLFLELKDFIALFQPSGSEQRRAGRLREFVMKGKG